MLYAVGCVQYQLGFIKFRLVWKRCTFARRRTIHFLNQNPCNQDICAPVATFVEMEVVHWLRQLLGYQVPSAYSCSQEAGGILTVGGCLSNTIAKMAAREKAFPGTVACGLPVLAQRV